MSITRNHVQCPDCGSYFENSPASQSGHLKSQKHFNAVRTARELERRERDALAARLRSSGIKVSIRG